jgi:hypothetical protein
MSVQADNVLKYARKFADEKYKEGANNDTTFGKWFGLNNQPWCMMFVMWCMSAGKAKDLVLRTAGCEAMEVQAGDILLFDFHKEGKSVHTGFALGGVNPNTHLIDTVEGNTCADGAGSQANGDGVYYKHRATTVVRCVVRPKWSN